MFCKKTDYIKIHRVQKRALRTIHQNFSLTFEELLLLENSISIHTKHLHLLMIETYKSINKLNPVLMWENFEIKNLPYCLRNHSILKLPRARTVTYGTNSILFKACFLWNSVPIAIKQSRTLSIFKTSISKWNCSSCSCSICR